MGVTFENLSLDDLCDLMCGSPEPELEEEGEIMAKTAFEKAFEKMTPAQRKKATQEVSDMMGMPPKRSTGKKATTRKKK